MLKFVFSNLHLYLTGSIFNHGYIPKYKSAWQMEHHSKALINL